MGSHEHFHLNDTRQSFVQTATRFIEELSSVTNVSSKNFIVSS